MQPRNEAAPGPAAPDFPLDTREDYIHFVEQRYFGAVRAADHDAVLATFAPDAKLVGYMGDAPARIMTLQPGPGEEPLTEFMQFAAHFELTYQDFVHFVDLDAHRVASHFTLLMVPRPGGLMAHMPGRMMRNCNFFQFRRGRLSDVIAYFSNPGGAGP